MGGRLGSPVASLKCPVVVVVVVVVVVCCYWLLLLLLLLLSQLKFLVAPRVQSACFSTTWNRWCTPRRFQNRSSKLNVFLLGFGGLAEDSIEHYSRCRAVRAVASSFLCLGRTLTVDIDHFMLSSEVFRDSPDVLICVAVLIYATYTSTNHLRFRGAVPLPPDQACFD